MELFETVIIALQLTNILAKKRYKERSSSEESIENILYYKDCNHKRKNNDPPQPLREVRHPPPPQQDCKMSCTMCCGGECVRNDQALPPTVSQIENFPNTMPRQPEGPIQPLMRPRKKKMKALLPPIGGRREFGFTRDNIKSLISQDDDIKKILKELVKVTMQKVDLEAMINARRDQVNGSQELFNISENDEV